jgi:hypothetical protein
LDRALAQGQLPMTLAQLPTYNPTTLNPPPLPSLTAVPTHFYIQPADNVLSGLYRKKDRFSGCQLRCRLSTKSVSSLTHRSFRKKKLNLLVEQWERMHLFCSFRLLEHQLM